MKDGDGGLKKKKKGEGKRFWQDKREKRQKDCRGVSLGLEKT